MFYVKPSQIQRFKKETQVLRNRISNRKSVSVYQRNFDVIFVHDSRAGVFIFDNVVKLEYFKIFRYARVKHTLIYYILIIYIFSLVIVFRIVKTAICSVIDGFE